MIDRRQSALQEKVPIKIGKYKIESLIGRGTFGYVYKGLNPDNCEYIAIKSLNKLQINKDQFLLNSLKQEIEVMKKLKSEHIVKLYETLESQNHIHLVMEYCPEGDLDHFIQKNGGMLEEKLAQNILIQLMQGFQEIVSHQYIHRDIKPANFLIKDGKHKIADFGFAVHIDIHNQQLLKEKVGTPLFMSPQILMNQEYSAKCDIWSIGMMYFFMLFGCTPWPCRDINSLKHNIQTKPLRFPYDKPIFKESKDFILNCLQINEQDRIGWNQIFKHPLLVQKNLQVHNSKNYFSQQSKYYLGKLQQVVQQYQINVRKVFQNFDKDHNGTLDKEEFFQLLKVIQQDIQQKDSNEIYKALRKMLGGEQLNFHNFSKIFDEYDFQDINDQTGKLISDLKEVIQINKMNLLNIFQKYDFENNDQLDYQEFEMLIKKILPGLKTTEIERIYKHVDINGDKQISFDEFFKTFAGEIPWIGNNQMNSQQVIRQAQNIVFKLKDTIKQHNYDLISVFRKHDKNNNGSLNKKELSHLLKKIKQDITEEEVDIIFAIFDTDGSKSIQFDEFYEQLK